MIYISNTDTNTLPYNDDHMKYSTSLRQYVATESGVLQYTGLNITESGMTPTEIEAFLIECSDDVYNYIYDSSLIISIPHKTFRIAKDASIRELFKRALMYQIRYAYRSGAHLVKDQHGINIEKSKFTNIKTLRNEIGIAKATIDKLNQMGLLFSGLEAYREFYDDDTY